MYLVYNLVPRCAIISLKAVGRSSNNKSPRFSHDEGVTCNIITVLGHVGTTNQNNESRD